LVLLVVVAVFGGPWIAKEEPSPAVMWSDMKYFSGNNVQIRETVSPYDLQKFILHAIAQEMDQGNPLLASVISNENPEVVVVFLEPKLSTSHLSQYSSAFSNGKGGSFKNLKNNIQQSITSIVAPYYNLIGYTQEDIHITITNVILLHLEQHPTAYTAFATAGPNSDFEKINQVTLANLMDTLKTKENLLHDGVTDLIVVQFTDLEIDLATKYSEDDELLGTISSYIKEVTNGKFLGMFTSSQASTLTRYASEEAHYYNYARSIDFALLANGTNGTSPNGTNQDTFFPVDVWEGLLVASVLFIITWIGVQCTFSLQSPEKFEGGRAR